MSTKNADDEMLWKEHGWVPYEAIKKAAAMYNKNDFNPSEAYDISIAMALLEESKDRKPFQNPI